MTSSDTAGKDNVAGTLGLDHTGVPKTHRARWLIAAAVIVLAAVGYMFYASRRESGVAKYVTQPVCRGGLVVTVNATGTLAPINKVEVGSEVSGTIKTVEVDYNDKVQVGQVIARLDTSRLEAQVLQAGATLESARARLLQAQATVQETGAQLARLDHVRELSNGKMPSQSDLDAAKAALARARADEAGAKATVEQAQATLDVTRTDLAKAVIHSPINGIVLVRSVEPGQTVAAALQSPVLFTLAEDLSRMELQVDVDEADVGQVVPGQDAVFTVDAYPDRTFPASVTLVRLGSQTVEGVVTYKTVLRVDNSNLALRPGMTARAVIQVNKVENVLLVPNAALRFTPPTPPTNAPMRGGSLLSSIMPRPPRFQSKKPDENGKAKDQHVWTVHNGQLTSIPITRGLSDGVFTEVAAGTVEPGMELVTDIEAAK